MWAGFFCRQDVSISIFGRTKEFSEVRGTSLMCNFGVRSRFLDVILYGVRPPNGSPAEYPTHTDFVLKKGYSLEAKNALKTWGYMYPLHACLVVNPITVGNFAFLFNCTPVGRTSDSMIVPT